MLDKRSVQYEMSRTRKIEGKTFHLLQYTKTKKKAQKVSAEERSTGSRIRILKDAVKYHGYPYSIWEQEEP